MAKKITREALALLAAPAKPNYERYGCSLCAYVTTPASITRSEFENALEAGGAKVNRAYWPGTDRVEITNVKVGS
jgi:hypothetical protein